ncbi:MAG: hypothetical protein IIA88_11690, partial [Bacteroidetes bacterium]|nr:hypothetical protein [Bacteroidota bacterium]
MKKTLLIAIGIFSFDCIYSQSISPEVYAASGEYYTSANATLSWTIGEGVIETFTGANAILTQGFQQSLYTITSIEEVSDNNYQISVYPNPATDFININVQS